MAAFSLRPLVVVVEVRLFVARLIAGLICPLHTCWAPRLKEAQRYISTPLHIICTVAFNCAESEGEGHGNLLMNSEGLSSSLWSKTLLIVPRTRCESQELLDLIEPCRLMWGWK